MGDRPVNQLGDKTPLEAASRPNFNALSGGGVNGIMDPIAPGIRPGSDTSHLSYLGYDPYSCYTGRGPIEAAGIGMDVRPGDVAFRANFGTVDDGMVVKDRRAGRITEGTGELAKALDGLEIDGVEVIFKESVAHRGALVLRGEGLGADITDVDPHEPGVKIHESQGMDEASKKTASVLNQFVRISHDRLGELPLNAERVKNGMLPANIILPRGAGILEPTPSFLDTHGLRGAAIAEVGLIYGVAKILGLDLIRVVGSTGGLDTDLEAIGRSATDALEDHDFVMCNVKGCDIAGHDGDAGAKKDFIEGIDSMLGGVMERAGEHSLLIVTADHSTPVSIMDHSGDPVPICIHGPGVRVDDVSEYGERSCARGGLGRFRGIDLINIAKDLMDMAEKFGA
jgi:2,3-bisphosphoglycerate-independent phosphoglycerate mutase